MGGGFTGICKLTTIFHPMIRFSPTINCQNCINFLRGYFENESGSPSVLGMPTSFLVPILYTRVEKLTQSAQSKVSCLWEQRGMVQTLKESF